RRPQSSPPFPYTTLFRSITQARFDRLASDSGDFGNFFKSEAIFHAQQEGYALFLRQFLKCDLQPSTLLELAQHAIWPFVIRCIKDRKSTRLNSSHVKISY